ncbi:MAG: hypothetical protein GX936_07970 [Clostridiales bacterium]|nr:hypothetical protein [Clostridiales bacterium]
MMINRDFRRYLIITMAALLVLSACLLAAYGLGLKTKASNAGDDISGCYAYVDCLYMSPLSSFMPFGSLPYVYGIGRDSLIIANTSTGDIWRYPARYEKTPVAENEFRSKALIVLESFPHPDLSLYKERWLRAVFTGSGGQYGLYQMDGEIWLVDFHGDRIWSIYRLKKTDKTALDDLERAYETLNESKGLPQMTLKDVSFESGVALWTMSTQPPSMSYRRLVKPGPTALTSNPSKSRRVGASPLRAIS